jgi:hypothetical protein
LSNLSNVTAWLQQHEPDYLDLVTASTEDEFDAALIPLLAKTVDHLESNSKNFSSLGETGLTAAFVGRLSGFGLRVTQETNSNGHVDVTITGHLCSPEQKRLGEAKLYKGYAYHIGGLEQLLGYMTGRASGYLLNYVRKQNIATLIEQLREKMNERLPHGQTGSCTDHKLKWSFSSLHDHSSGEPVRVSHIGFNIHSPSRTTRVRQPSHARRSKGAPSSSRRQRRP